MPQRRKEASCTPLQGSERLPTMTQLSRGWAIAVILPQVGRFGCHLGLEQLSYWLGVFRIPERLEEPCRLPLRSPGAKGRTSP